MIIHILQRVVVDDKARAGDKYWVEVDKVLKSIRESSNKDQIRTIRWASRGSYTSTINKCLIVPQNFCDLNAIHDISRHIISKLMLHNTSSV